MSEEFKNLRDLAKDRQPGTPGLYAAEMLRRCELRFEMTLEGGGRWKYTENPSVPRVWPPFQCIVW